MENTKVVVLQLKLTQKRCLFALAFAFLCFHPRPLGSETLSLSTYYPAPYGGYVAILTTGGSAAIPVNTLLARDGGNVGIGTPNPGAKLDVGGSANISSNLNVGNSLDVTGNASVRGSLDVTGDSTLLGSLNVSGVTNLNNNTYVGGDLTIGPNGVLKGLCQIVQYGSGVTFCPFSSPGHGYMYVVGAWGWQSCNSGGSVFLGGDLSNPGNWAPYKIEGCGGSMMCCRIEP